MECCEIHEKMWVISGNVFDSQHARRDSDELYNDSRNLATSSTILRTEGIEKKSESEEPSQSKLISCFSMRARQMSGRWEKSVLCLWLTKAWVLGLVLKAWQFRVISPRRCICKNSLTQWNSRAGSCISEQKFAQRPRNKRKGAKFLHRSENWRIGSCSRRDSL